MILGQITWPDIFIFLLFLTPQLLIHIGLFGTIKHALLSLPFLLIRLPLTLFYERYVQPAEQQASFVRKASLFEDVVIRCVRYAFANLPARVGRVFFSKWIALPFLRFRMLRHGYLSSPIKWHEVSQREFKGIWIIEDEWEEPDLVLYYAHGGGFSMGSSYFYLEFLLAWLTLLKESGFRNPAIFALEYTLVPEASYPSQIQQAIAAYKHVLSITNVPSHICLSGDSAGATLVLSLLLHLKRYDVPEMEHIPVPGLVVLISPWVTLVSYKDRNTTSDYLDVDILHHYGRQYAGVRSLVADPLVSPGNCRDEIWWRRAVPTKGLSIFFGADEVFAPEIRDLAGFLKKTGLRVDVEEEPAGIHAWPVVDIFLSSSITRRQRGLRMMAGEIRSRLS